ncbi:MAG: alpha/beta hydrolase [Clostridia bacterium]|nr:alpha/beta hydrolase [Clostridia bacterium]
MIYQVINIELDYKKIGADNGGFQPIMTLYLPSNSHEIELDRKRPTVIICPGGGYSMTSDREAEAIAFKFIAEDCNAVVVRYSCAPARFPIQLLELSWVVSKMRENSDEWNVDTNKISVMGFSAGGHLAASYGTLWNKDFIKEYFGLKGGENKPNGMILCYPVITSGPKANFGSFENLLGDKKDDEELRTLLSAEKQVTADTPPAFIWHTFADNAVPVENSLLMATALTEKKIPTELHIFPLGWHGLSLCNSTVLKPQDYHGEFDECQVWIDMAIRWLKNL